ncbi:MAG: NAD-dependent deacylase [Oligoflexia bacterium]|nr:NAD-dependent deacylase [Oligoflexia bacterium]
MRREKLVVLTGAGISAESGLKTFRDSDGLWEGYRIQDVATPAAWVQDPVLVLDFYNERRRAVQAAAPNPAHLALAALEQEFKVTIITQNIDDLHERAGSSDVLHLHGEIYKARSTLDPKLIYSIKGTELNPGDRCEKGSQLRPHIVWFGEAVPEMERAIEITKKADLFAVVGTSLVVYPAASLVQFVSAAVPIYLVDPKQPEIDLNKVIFLQEKATQGVPKMATMLAHRLKRQL